MNRKFLYQPSEVDAVVLSHSHIDHAGNLPTLMVKGFSGSIYCTSASRDLCSIMLQDSAYIQEKDVEFVNKKRAKKGEPLFNPLYTVPQAVEVMKQFKSFPYRKSFKPDNFESNVKVTFHDAGHILGSAQVVVEISEKGKSTKIGFSGDLGRNNLPILKDPDFIGDVDYLIIESTYGGKFHSNANIMGDELARVITGAMKTNAKIIVPSFSVGRAQELVYELSKLTSKRMIPEFPIFVDSPLTVNVTEIFKLHPECFDIETSKLLASGVNVFGLENVLYIKDVEDSKKLNSVSGPCMIISASGMCEAGRILHHLSNNIGNPDNMVMIIGYMAANTLGRRLIESKDENGAKVKIFGEEHRVKAKIEVLDSFSAHADHNDIINYIKLFDKNKLKKIFLVHGEFEKQKILLDDLISKGYNNIIIPDRGEEYNLN